MEVTAAWDFFVVPAITFRLLFAFVGIPHDRSRILHINVTAHPTPEETAWQVIEAFSGDGWGPGFLNHDRATHFGDFVKRCCKTLGTHEVLGAYRSPCQDACSERMIGSIRRECLDNMIGMGQMHCRRLLIACARYYEEVGPHQPLDGSSPLPRWVEAPAGGRVVVVPELDGLQPR